LPLLGNRERTDRLSRRQREDRSVCTRRWDRGKRSRLFVDGLVVESPPSSKGQFRCESADKKIDTAAAWQTRQSATAAGNRLAAAGRKGCIGYAGAGSADLR